MNPTDSPVKPIPQGMHTVTPHLICAGAAEAIEFYKKAFSAVELSRMPDSDGKVMHASIRIGDSIIMLNDEMPAWGTFGPKSLKGSPVTIHLYVENADAVFEQAVRAGAKVTMPIADMFWGDRYGKVEDPFGHQWSIGTHVRDASAGGDAKGDGADGFLTSIVGLLQRALSSRKVAGRIWNLGIRSALHLQFRFAVSASLLRDRAQNDRRIRDLRRREQIAPWPIRHG